MFDFPNSPATDDAYRFGAKRWRFDSVGWRRTDAANLVSIDAFGAIPDFDVDNPGANGTDNTAAIQAAIDYCISNGGTLKIPAGQYGFRSKLSVIRPSNSYLHNHRCALLGEGPGLSQLFYCGPDDDYAIDIQGHDTEPGEHLTHGGFFLVNWLFSNIGGIRLLNEAWMELSDIGLGFFESAAGLRMDGAISLSLNRLFIHRAGIGIQMERTTGFSDPNAISVNDCRIHSAASKIMYLKNPCRVSINGGTFENNAGPLHIDNVAISVATGMAIRDAWFEGNAGANDILAENAGNSFEYSLLLEANNFWRGSGSTTTNCIAINNASGSLFRFTPKANQFPFAGSYTPDAGRKNIVFGGTGAIAIRATDDGSNVFYSELERPFIAAYDVTRPAVHGRYRGAIGVLDGGHNVDSVVKNGTGDYTINYHGDMLAEPEYFIGLQTPGQYSIFNETLNAVRIKTFSDFAGTIASDRTFHFAITPIQIFGTE